MLVGRFWMIIPAMAIAGSLAEKKSVPPSSGTFPTTGGLFIGLVVGVILIIGGLTFFPALALGPIVEHLAMRAGTLFSSNSSRSHVDGIPLQSRKGSRYRPCSIAKIVLPAIGSAFVKLDPRVLIKNPVMFVLEVVTVLTTIIFVRDLVTGGANLGFEFQIVLWLWFTVLFANFAEAVAEGRGKAQAESLRRTRTETQAKLLTGPDRQELSAGAGHQPQGRRRGAGRGRRHHSVGRRGGRGHRFGERGGDHRQVGAGHPRVRRRPLGGHRRHPGAVRLDRVRITAAPGSTFLDRMITLVEGAERQKTPNEIALNILLAGMTIIFVFAVATIPSYAAYAGGTMSVVVLVALFVTLIPTTIGALLSAIGIAGMDRLVRFNVLAMSGRAVEAAGDVDTLLLDKTGTITLGNRQATEFKPVRGVTEQELADAAQLASLADETPKAAPSWCLRRKNTASAAANWPSCAAISSRSRRRAG